MTISNSQFENNVLVHDTQDPGDLTQGGGAVFLSGGSLLITEGTSFSRNLASQGAAVRLVGTDGSISAAQFTGNVATVTGGALYLTSTPALTVTGCSFLSNSAGIAGQPRGSGAAIATDSAALTVLGGVFDANQAQSHGGAFYLGGTSPSAVVVLQGLSLLANAARLGAAQLYATDSASLSLSASNVSATASATDLAFAQSANASLKGACGALAIGVSDRASVAFGCGQPSLLRLLSLSGAAAKLTLAASLGVGALQWSGGALECVVGSTVSLLESAVLANDSPKTLDRCVLAVSAGATAAVNHSGPERDLTLANGASIANYGVLSVAGGVSFNTEVANGALSAGVLSNHGTVGISGPFSMGSAEPSVLAWVSAPKSRVLLSHVADCQNASCATALKVVGSIQLDGYLIASTSSLSSAVVYWTVQRSGQFSQIYVLKPPKDYAIATAAYSPRSLSLVVSPLSGVDVFFIVIGSLSMVYSILAVIFHVYQIRSGNYEQI